MSDTRGDKPKILQILERLNRARAAGDTALVAELDAELNQYDARRNYSRQAPLERYVPPVTRHPRKRAEP